MLIMVSITMQNIDWPEIYKYEVISFDLYDTLISRIVGKPSNIFRIIGERFNIQNFSEIRINAEKQCREKSNNEEITLNDIYVVMSKIININLDAVCLFERELERNLTKINKNGYDLYKYCFEKNKKIIIVSDMYLPLEDIVFILGKHKIKYNKLYLSSNIKKTKASGAMFDFVCQDLNISKSKVLHIGDNKGSDVNVPRAKGIDAWQIFNKKSRESKQIIDIVFNNLAADRKYKKDSIEYIGYTAFGRLLIGFCQWLMDECKKKNIKKLYFLARDGFFIKQAFDILYPESDLLTTYMLASRRAVSVPLINKLTSVDDIINLCKINEKDTCFEIIKKTGLEKSNLHDKFDVNKILTRDEIISFIEANNLEIVENAEFEANDFKNYLDKINFTGQVAIIDIGWFGSMQENIDKFCKRNKINVNITGFYVGCRRWNKKQNRYGFAFQNQNNNERYLIDSMNPLFETFFLPNKGSLISYHSNGTFCDNEYSDNSRIILNRFQTAAIDCVNDLSKFRIHKYCKFTASNSMEPLYRYFMAPRRGLAIQFGNIEFYDYSKKFIAKPEKIINYIYKPSSFVNDLKKCRWKIGFLTRIFGMAKLWKALYLCSRII